MRLRATGTRPARPSAGPIGLAEEHEPPGEAALRRQIDATLERQYERAYPPQVRPALRDQHAKAHGCVRAELRVADDLPPALRHGLFAAAGTYPAWVRFSASSPHLRPDARRDARGMAIKVLGVPGAKVLPAERDAATQDFVLANSPVFFCRDVADYVALTAAVARGRMMAFFLGSWRPWRWRLRELVNMVNAIRRRVDDPLTIRYWSQTPYRLGPHAVKYSATPRSSGAPRGRFSGPDRLEAAMAAHLRDREAVFDLGVQLQRDPRRMPVEDPTVRWSERRSPFRMVATLRIPVQAFDDAARWQLAESLSFTPWHALPEHAPLGGINRVRRSTYELISRLRHDRNGVAREEPAPSA